MLVGRDAEQARIDGLVRRTRRGRGGALVVAGEAGVGKTALVDAAAEANSDLVVLRTTGVAAEAPLGFAGLTDLLRPLSAHLREAAGPRAAALAAAAGLGPPAGADGFVVAAAALELLCSVAEERPVLVVVDDFQWVDRASAQVVAYVARRVRQDPVACVLTVRTDHRHRLPSAAAVDGLARLLLAGLAPGPAATLLSAAARSPVGESVAVQVVAATGGNPLALVETARLLPAGQLAGHDPLDDPLPVGPRLQASLLSSIADDDPCVRASLLLAACDSAGDSVAIAKALPHAGGSQAALEAAEADGLVTTDGANVRFRHPLLRAAVHEDATPAQRRAAHAALAKVYAELEMLDARAWHLAEAAERPSDDVAVLLEQAAAGSRGRGAPVAAAQALARAAQLSPVAADRCRRLLAAARDAHTAGEVAWAARLARDALQIAEEPALRADVELLRGSLEMAAGSGRAALAAMSLAAAEVEATDAARAARLRIGAATAALMSGDVHAVGRLAAAAKAGARADPMTTFAAETVEAIGRAMGAQGRAAVATAARVLAPQVLRDPPAEFTALLVLAALACAWHDDERALPALDMLVAGARRARTAGRLPFPLAARADVLWREGRWEEARADASEAVEAARRAGHRSTEAYALACRARVAAARGDAQAVEHDSVAAQRIVARGSGDMLRFHIDHACGLLAAGAGDHARARAILDPLAERADAAGLREPNVVPFLADLVDACVVGDDLPRARDVTGLLEAAAADGSGWTAGAAAYCQAVTATRDDSAARLRDAITAFGPKLPFARARAQLALGRLLRRQRRRAEADVHLHAALQEFDRLGAAPWAGQVRGELGLGRTKARAAAPALAAPALAAPAPDLTVPAAPDLTVQDVTARDLTAQEVRVALLVAQGITNREAAAQLFVSEKTVEAHLGRIYRKLGLRSRTQLAVAAAAWRRTPPT